MRTISVANQKGGCGKTTTCINLARALALSGKRVLAIDLDPQAHMSFGLGVANAATDKSIYNVLTDTSEKRRTLDDCIMNVSGRLDIIPSNILLSTIEQELKDTQDAVSKLHHILADQALPYEYAIIDCPPSLGFLTFNALRAADLVIIPIDMSAFSLMGVGKLLGMLELIKLKIGHAPQVKALATLFDRRTKYSQVMFDEIKTFFKEEMLETIIRTNVALKKAVAKGVSVIDFDKECNGALDYCALAQEVTRGEASAEFEAALRETTATGDALITLTPPRVEAPVTVAIEKIQPEEKKREAVSATRTENPREAAFTIKAPAAREVYLVGDFNHWKINDESKLNRDKDGIWEKKLGLPAGKYRYKFVIDGEWVLDARNADKEQNPYGSFDSIIALT